MAGPGNSVNETTTGICGFTGTAFTGTAVTNHNVILGGSASSTLTNVAPSATSGVPLISQGASADPAFGTAVVAGGGTGAVTLTGILTGNGTSAVTANAVTQHGVLIGGASNAASSLGVAATGTVLTGSTGADPAFSATPAVTSITLNGTSALNNYTAPQSFTPSLKFGGATTGITYTTQVGYYVTIGKLCMFSIDITLSSKGSATGGATINVPLTSNASEGTVDFIWFLFGTGTQSAGTTYYIAELAANGTAMTLNNGLGLTASAAAMTNTNFGNTDTIRISGSYMTT